jgi:methylglutaconyl-CoA hydratase
MSDDPILIHQDGPAAVITLNRPDRRNALNVPLLERLCDAVDTAAADSEVRAIVLRGAGKVFCAGLDMAEAGDPDVSHRSAGLVARMLETVYAAPKVTIAAVHGAALAGGAGLMSACDIVLAADGCKIGYPEVHRGMVAGLVMTFLRRQVHERHARELLLLGEIIEAERAAEMGLVTRCVPTDTLDEALAMVLAQVAKAAPGAIATTKTFFDQLHQRPLRADLDAALDLHVAVRNAGEAQEGMRAFVEKRLPAWQQGQA